MQPVRLSVMPACDQLQQDKPVISVVHQTGYWINLSIVVINDVVSPPLLQDNILAADWLRCGAAN